MAEDPTMRRSSVLSILLAASLAVAVVPALARDGGAGPDHLTGGGGADTMNGGGGNDTLRGMGGADRLNGDRGNDTISGGTGADAIDGGDGDDQLHGGPGDDRIVEAAFGDDTIYGDDGNDTIKANNGNDTIFAGAGDDVISGGSGLDDVDCGPGQDILYYNLRSDLGRAVNCEQTRDEADIAQRLCEPRSGARAVDQREPPPVGDPSAPSSQPGLQGTEADEQVRGGPDDDLCEG